ncbi:lipopolysaccharide biosynthesis protein [Aquamicrobium sp. LC103]|uniref:lipopolysaccharide biosynthesis protein n=1 Tax=Aquamicrobium sp. LC103 TaxID=1120658 RepID=UPI000699F45C|nr:lipopolysaccharide biosynthesis protein [Aquamicrobium sp. LC103]
MLDRTNAQEGEQKAEFAHLRTGRAQAAMRGIFWAALNSFAPAAVAAAVFAITSRYLSPAEFGLVALAASITMLGSAFGPGGFGEALVQRQDIEARHLNAVFWLCLVAALVIYGMLLASSPWLETLLGEQGLRPLLAVIGLRVIFDMAAIVPNSLLARSMSFNKLAMRTTIASFVAAAVCLALLFLGYGLWALAISQLAASAAACAGSVLSVRWRPSFSFDNAALREVTRYGMFASGHRILQMVSVDQLLIGALLGTAALGIFSFARRIHQLLSDLIGGALKMVSFTVLSSMQSEEEKLRETFFFATFASSAMSFPIFVGLAAVATDFVPLVFGPHWLEAVPALQAFCLVGLLTCIGLLQSSLINSQGRVSWWMYYQIAQQAATALVVLLFHRYGITVVAFAFAAKTFLLWPATVWMTLRLLKTDAVTYLAAFVAPTVASLAMLAAVFTIRGYTDGYGLVETLAAQISGGAAVYIVVLAAFAHRRLLQASRLFLKRRPVAP